MLRHLCRKADHIVTVSNYSKEDIIKFFGLPEERKSPILFEAFILPEALSRPEAEVAKALANAFHVDSGNISSSSGRSSRRKTSRARFIDAYAASGSRHPLLIAGGLGWQYDRDLEKIPIFAE